MKKNSIEYDNISELASGIIALPDAERKQLNQYLLAHGIKLAKTQGWKKLIVGAAATLLGAVALAASALGLTSCSITPEQAAQMQRVAQGIAPLIVILPSEK